MDPTTGPIHLNRRDDPKRPDPAINGRGVKIPRISTFFRGSIRHILKVHHDLCTVRGDCLSMSDQQPDTIENRQIVELEHWFFSKMEGLRFQADDLSGQPRVVVPYQKTEAGLSFAAIAKEFAISPESPDGIMLARIATGLKYVKGLFPGDPLPKEILTGEASWTLSPKHILIAHQRVAMRLVSLMSGDEPTISDPAELLKMVDDPAIKKKINVAFGVAAEKLGLPPEQKGEVIEFVNRLANEMAYIEALRERFDDVIVVREKVQLARKKYSREPLVRETTDQVARLIEKAAKEYGGVFKEIDAHTAEIMEMLRNLADEIIYIRRHRDDLHVRLLAWDDLLTLWAETKVECSMKVTELIRATHRFLAPRFLTAIDWLEMARQERMKSNRGPVKSMSWG
jgi:hypothetical protein